MPVTYRNFLNALDEFGKLSTKVSKICKERSAKAEATGSKIGAFAGAFFGEVGSAIGEAVGAFGGRLYADKKNLTDQVKATITIRESLEKWESKSIPIIQSYLSTCEGLEETYSFERDYYIRQLKNLNTGNSNEVKANADLLAQCIASDFQRHYSVELGRKIVSFFKECYDRISYLESFDAWKENYLRIDKSTLYRTSYDRYAGYIERGCPDLKDSLGTVLICFASNHPVYLGDPKQTEEEDFIASEAFYEAYCQIRGKEYLRKLPGYIYAGSAFVKAKGLILKKLTEKYKEVKKTLALYFLIGYSLLAVVCFMLVNVFVKLWRYTPDVLFLNTWHGNAFLAFIVIELIMFIIYSICSRKALKEVVSEMCPFVEDGNTINQKEFDKVIMSDTSAIQERIRKELISAQEKDALSEDELLALAAEG